MRRRLLAFIITSLLSIFAVHAKPLPFTAKEISLMLRSGYTSDTVMGDLAKRHFADTIDPAPTIT